MAGPRREMRAVELVEADVLDDAAWPAPGGGPGGTPADRPGRPPGTGPARPAPPPARAGRPGVLPRRVRAVGVVVAAVVALLALGGAVVTDRREDARLRSLAGVPDIVAPLDGPVTGWWRARGWTGSDLRDVGGRLVGVVSTPYETVDLVALDPGTGRDVWRTALSPAAVGGLRTDCVVPGAPFPEPVPEPHPVAVCVAVDRTATTEQSALGSKTYPTRVRLVVVDAVDGTVLRDAPAPATSRVLAIGTDAVVAHVDPDGRGRVARVDARTGVERWSFTTPEPVPPDRFGQRSVVVQVAGDVVALDAGATWVLSGDGEVLPAWSGDPSPLDGSPVALLAGGGVLARTTAVADGGWGTEVVDVEGGTTWSAPGFPVRARPDDGSLDDLVLLRSHGSQTLAAHDRSTGELRWRVHLPSSVPVAVLDERVLGVDGPELRALDGRTGTGLWATRLERPAQGPLVSDGRLVLVSRPAAEGGGVLTAVGLEDGRPRWSSPVDHALFLFAVDGRLYGWSARGLQALGAEDAR